MQTSFAIDYIVFPEHNSRVLTHRTDDPVAVEDFLMHLLATGARIREIRHDSLALGSHQFDQMLKVAAGRIAAQMLRKSLGLDSVKIKDRFGFAA
jgi:hypothetical protein